VEGLKRLGYQVSVICNQVGKDNRINLTSGHKGSLLDDTHRWWRMPQLFDEAVSHLPSRWQDRCETAADIFFNGQLNACDLIIAHYGHNGLRLARVKKRNRLRPPFLTIYHGIDVGLPAHNNQLKIYRSVFEQGALQLTVSERFKDELIHAGADPEKVVVHRMGVDCEAIRFTKRERKGPLRLISVCRLVEKKGMAFALRALALVSKASPELKWQYQVVGEGPLLDELRQSAKDLGIERNVEFRGGLPHEEVKLLLSEAHIFLLPSVTARDGDTEGVPVALMEAMAAGLVVVSSHHAGIPELVTDGRSGLLAKERDVDGLVSHLLDLAAHPEKADALAREARSEIELNFDNSKLNARLSDIIQDLVHQRRAA
jgi:colanic acid/amylovoran biosynthesis glycosyltransferase